MRALREREGLDAHERLDGGLREMRRQGFRIHERIAGTSAYEVGQLKAVHKKSGLVVYAGGKGTPGQARLSLIYEAIEHAYLAARESKDHDGGRQSLESIAVQASLSEDLLIKRMAEDFPTVVLRTDAYTHISGQTPPLTYPIMLNNPYFRDPSHIEIEPYLKYCSNSGVAVGVTYSEAALHAVLEVVERDAVSLALIRLVTSSANFERVNLRAAGEGITEIGRLIRLVSGAEVQVIEISTLTEVHTMMAFVRSEQFAGLLGAGTSIYKDYAIERALGELLQVISISAWNGLMGMTRRRRTIFAQWPLLQRIYDGNYDLVDLIERAEPELGSQEYTRHKEGQSVASQLETVTASLREDGFEVYVRNLAPEGANVAAVSSVVPGLERFSTTLLNGAPCLPVGRGAELLAAVNQ